MQALKRFIQNAGIANTFKLLVVMVLLYFAMTRDIRSGLAIITLPVMLISLIAPRLIRDRLINHFELIKTIMNFFVIGSLIAVAVFGKSKSAEPDALRVLMCLVFSLYIGIYFWVLSDERIYRS